MANKTYISDSASIRKRISERTGLSGEIVDLVVEEYALTIREMIIQEGKAVSLLGLGVAGITDRGENSLNSAGIAKPRYGLSFRTSRAVLEYLHRKSELAKFKSLHKTDSQTITSEEVFKAGREKANKIKRELLFVKGTDSHPSNTPSI